MVLAACKYARILNVTFSSHTSPGLQQCSELTEKRGDLGVLMHGVHYVPERLSHHYLD